MDLKSLTIKKAHEDLLAKKYTVLELVNTYLENIKKRDSEIHAYLEVFNDVSAQAKMAQEKIDSGKASILTGIPFAIKDNILIEGKIASASSKMLENYHATYDATVIKKLKDAGAIFLGRTNMDEFAMGGSTENSAFGVTKNPHDVARVAGGSSGGSAAALAMDGCLVALGTDTGGSVRQPASFCGVIGLKPTYGAISRHGLIAMGSSLDQAGPFTKTVGDMETVFDLLAGRDFMDATTISPDTYKKSSIKNSLTIGVPRHAMEKGIDAQVLSNFEESLVRLKKLGHTVVDMILPNIGYALPVYYVLMPAEVSSNLARFDGVKYGLHVDGKNSIEDYFASRAGGFGKETRRRILLGTYVLSSGYYDAYYNKANALRKTITKDFTNAFTKVDVILTPTTPTPAFKIGEKASDPLSMYLEDIFTVTANLTGMPAMSIPSGFAKEGSVSLPLGIQMTAPHGREDVLFALGKDFLGEK
ncbi:Asp-tRNA(Asn)/Glu-tRNA(Gln) amidotransferase subunit GatA [Patescibacteria group bacterium]|nr:MAG: Asp-tRNA(Asn)/Glu-tRNA(Gln) amidotransferase subunit GatA [Patescibacteria group bacterium]